MITGKCSYLSRRLGCFFFSFIDCNNAQPRRFPVSKELLRPCLSLTKYVRDTSVETAEIRVDIDCCTFDRVLLFLLATQRNQEYKFPLEELDVLLHAAQELKLVALRRLCESRKGEFERRIRTEGVGLDEVFRRNSDGETLLLIDGMVFDVTEWLPEHPGGNYIIPTQALNKNATVFFELYHASKESFIYLKQLYIGRLHSKDIPKVPEPSKDYAKPSMVFLQQLREYMRPDNLTTYKSF